jgi:hypothetical protein
MGQLKTGIATLQKALAENESNVAKIDQVMAPHRSKTLQLVNTTAEGANSVLLYLVEKFKTSGGVNAHASQKLSELGDAQVVTLVKGIVGWKQAIKAAIQKRNQDVQAVSAGALATLTNAEKLAGQLKALAQKKKDKWFKSPKYKDKIKGYLAAIDSAEATVKKQKAAISKLNSSKFTDAWVDKSFPASMDMTVAQMAAEATAAVDAQIAVYLQDQATADAEVKTFRDENKSVAGQLAVFKKWIDDADAMEADAK